MRPLAPADHPRLIGASQVATLRRSREAIAAALSFDAGPFDDADLGRVTAFVGETDAGAPFALFAHAMDESAWSVIAHSIADLPAVMAALGIGERELAWRAKADGARPWGVIRQDADGAKAIVQRTARESDAKRACAFWQSRGGAYSVERV